MATWSKNKTQRNEEIEVPVTEDGEFIGINKTVPMINKKYCKIRANINSSIKREYFGEWYEHAPQSNVDMANS
jgi:hypothetical protein